MNMKVVTSILILMQFGVSYAHDCKAGYGGTNCDMCPNGQYSLGGSEDACLVCPGTSTHDKYTSITESDCSCTPGSKFISGTGCEVCTGDTWAETKDTSCTPCASGTFVKPANQPGTSASACELYPACGYGTWRTSTDPWKCKDCGTGTYSMGHVWSATSTSSSCDDCPSGSSVSAGMGVYLEDCKCTIPGQEHINGVCTPCQKDTYSDPYDGTTCKACPSFSTVAAGSGVKLDSCECEAGKFLDLPNTVTCTDCPANHYAEKGTKVSCNSCLDGRTVAAGQGVKADSCTCPAGTYWNVRAVDPLCSPCPENYWSDKDQSACTKCTGELKIPGGSGTSETDCKCPAGKYRKASDNTCIDCAADSYNESNRDEKCSVCPGETIVPYGQGTQYSKCVCPSGHYILSAVMGCTECPAQTYSDGTARNSCSSCIANSVVAAGAGTVSTDCECQAGFYFDSSNVACKPCPSNQWAAAGKTGSCTACPSTSFIPSTGNHHSVEDCVCPAASHMDSEGICQACDINTWAVQGTDDGCSPCATNTEVDVGLGVSAESCHCPAGTFYDVITLDSDDAFIRSSHMDMEELATKMLTEKGCQYCKENKWSSGGRTNSCTACQGDLTVHKGLGTSESLCVCAAGHYYSTKNTEHICTPCPENTWAPAGLHRACNVCEVGRDVGVGKGISADDCSASARATTSTILLFAATLGLLLW